MKILIYVKLFIVFLLSNLFVGGSCEPVVETGANDLEINKKIVAIAYSLTNDCPAYFIHPDVYDPPNEPDLVKSDRGQVAWTPTGIMGASPTGYFLESKDTFIRRLNKASVSEQTSYSQYQQIQDAGFPGMVDNDGVQFPDRFYQAGFVCYAYVTRAIRDAGITINNSLSVDETIDQLMKISIINATTVKTGDIVAYDFNNNGEWDHCGVINVVDGNNPEDWTVFSSNGLVELFEYGATETRLGVFQSPENGGYFTWWGDLSLYYEIYTKRNIYN